MRVSSKVRHIAARHSSRAVSFVDQGLLGLAALTINIVLARYLPTVAFASISMMIGAHYFIFSIHRASIVLPFILDDESSGGAEAANAHRRRSWWTANLVFIGFTACLLAMAAFAVVAVTNASGMGGWLGDVLLYLVPTTPALLLFEFGRRMLYQAKKVGAVALASLFYFLAGTLSAGLGMALGSEMIGGLAFAIAGLAGSLVSLFAVAPRPASLNAAWPVWKAFSGFSAWQSLTSIPYNFYSVSPVVLIGFFGGPGAAAGFAAARTLVSPAFSIVSAVDSLDKPRAARAMATSGLSGLHASISQTRMLLAVLAGSYLALIAILAPWVLDAAFAGKYADNADAVRVLAIAFFCMSLNQPAETMLIVLRRLRSLFYIRAAAALAVVAGIGVGTQWGGLIGGVWAIAAVQFAVLVALSIVEFATLKQKT